MSTVILSLVDFNLNKMLRICYYALQIFAVTRILKTLLALYIENKDAKIKMSWAKFGRSFRKITGIQSTEGDDHRLCAKCQLKVRGMQEKYCRTNKRQEERTFRRSVWEWKTCGANININFCLLQPRYVCWLYLWMYSTVILYLSNFLKNWPESCTF